MFKDTCLYESEIKVLLEVYEDLEDLFDALDITINEVLSILLQGGHVELPPFLQEAFNEESIIDNDDE